MPDAGTPTIRQPHAECSQRADLGRRRAAVFDDGVVSLPAAADVVVQLALSRVIAGPSAQPAQGFEAPWPGVQRGGHVVVGFVPARGTPVQGDCVVQTRGFEAGGAATAAAEEGVAQRVGRGEPASRRAGIPASGNVHLYLSGDE